MYLDTYQVHRFFALFMYLQILQKLQPGFWPSLSKIGNLNGVLLSKVIGVEDEYVEEDGMNLGTLAVKKNTVFWSKVENIGNGIQTRTRAQISRSYQPHHVNRHPNSSLKDRVVNDATLCIVQLQKIFVYKCLKFIT